MSELGEGIIQGLKEAKALLRGEDVDAVVHIPYAIDVKRIREKLGMTQTKFADEFAFKLGTLRDWEQGRRVPDAAAKTLLTVIDKEPDAVRRALTSAAREE